MKYSVIIFAITINLILLTMIEDGRCSEEEISALQVMQKMDAVDDGDSEISQLTMILFDSKKNQRNRKLKTIRKDYGEDKKQLIFFLSPADVRDTAYLSFDWDDEGKEDDAWLYLPSLSKVMRIASSDKSDSFLGSDFSYTDIDGLEISDWEYRFAKTNDVVDGFDTWVVEGLPKSSIKNKIIKKTGYLKFLMWIRKDNNLRVRAKYWVKKGKRIKYLSTKDIRQVEGIWTTHEINMVTTRKEKVEHSSVIRYNQIEYNSDVNDNILTVQQMERGL